MQNEEWGWEQVELVPSEQFKGFLTCSNCKKPIIEPWNAQIRLWRYCPYCGRHFKKEAENEKD